MKMSSRRVAELDDQCLRVSHDPTSDEFAINLVPIFFEFLRDSGRPIEDIKTVYNGVSLKEDGNKGYVVCEIETLEYPLDDPICDAAEHQVSVWCCSCPGYSYHKSPDLREGEKPSEAGECSHISRVKRKERQEIDDENQSNLGDIE